MEKYTIDCTPELTKKALELGVPIKTSYNRFDNDVSPIYCENDRWLYAVIPTVEQMICWLDEQGIPISILAHKCRNIYRFAYYLNDDDYSTISFESREAAILDAIDVALDYLIHKA